MLSNCSVKKIVGMGLCLYVDLCFHASSLPCLHTFWHAIPTSFYVCNVLFSCVIRYIYYYPKNAIFHEADSEWKIGESLRCQTCRVFASKCSAGTRDWLAPSLSNNKNETIFRWGSNNDAAFGVLPFESTLCANNKVTRCKANSSFHSTQHYLL